MAYRAVYEYLDQGSGAIKIISMAKAFVSEQCQDVINECLQIHGGWGYMEDYGIVDEVRHKHQLVPHRAAH